MALRDILKHRATPIRMVEGEWVEGETRVEPVRDESFDAVIFLPNAGMEGRRGRVIEKPQLMYLPAYPAPPVGSGDPVALEVGDRVGVVAAEQNAALGLDPDAENVWVVESTPQPLGKPGRSAIGIYATVRRVTD